MDFILKGRNETFPSGVKNSTFLTIDNWNDFSFTTMFYVTLFDEIGSKHDIGNVKIGFKGQIESETTASKIGKNFTNLNEIFFSLGTDVDYYKKLSKISADTCEKLLIGLRDIVFSTDNLKNAMGERVFSTSLLRGVSINTINEQFKRVLSGGAERTDFSFIYKKQSTERMAGFELSFEVKALSTPSTNIHAIIGRNGVGKTTILNGMIEAVTGSQSNEDGFFLRNIFGNQHTPINSGYFSSLVSVSFSAFDPFDPPAEQSNPEKGTCYFYIGLKESSPNGSKLKVLPQLHAEYLSSLRACVSEPRKRNRWHTAIKALESDENFGEMGLPKLLSLSGHEFIDKAMELISRMSSGHAVVLLTITKLVSTVEEKTLVILDEPESHLHPPLLSAFIRALSELLHDRNGVAIIATHSPVVIQELPTSCAWKINRSRLIIDTKRPEIQTFGENVGVLTREVFGLEVKKSGFHKMLELSVQKGGTFEQIMYEYNFQLGFEAQAILRAMICSRMLGEA
ncbi:AAA family ATPase [Pseudomonas koreensis]|uniref:ATPase AAA-type core domain-containing protein n=1 Tax=Pseudomonas koreensis TaxID=198620 RepID=A0AA94EJN6_9PSED|nr:AAA family ATPase [Pseudomonas koreensis]RVD75501.1 hypothetical protein A9HBioS_4621 [Pseudomonas koreensis]